MWRSDALSSGFVTAPGVWRNNEPALMVVVLSVQPTWVRQPDWAGTVSSGFVGCVRAVLRPCTATGTSVAE